MGPVRILAAVSLVLGLVSPSSAGESVLGRLQVEIRKLARDARPAVVKVTAVRERALTAPWGESRDEDGVSLRALLRQSTSVGTGFLVSEDGLVLTTHRIAEAAEGAKVEFPDGTIRNAEILGHDPFFQVAVLKVEPAEGVRPLALAPASECVPGSLGLLVGNGLGVSGNMSLGIVTADRASGRPGDDYDNYLVLNTPVRPGDAGGPFLDAEGRVLGMAVGAYSGAAWIVASAKGIRIDGSRDPAGMGYLVPAPDLALALSEIRDHGEVRRGRLGVRVNLANLEVGEVVPGTPAAEAGFLAGDVLVGLMGRDLGSYADLFFHLRRARVGASISLRIRRDGEEIELVSRVDRAPPSIAGLPLREDEEGRAVVGTLRADFADSGLEEGDVILRVEDREVDSVRAAVIALARTYGSGRARLTVLRDGDRIELTILTR
jgi:S1-C subfamily serine protease